MLSCEQRIQVYNAIIDSYMTEYMLSIPQRERMFRSLRRLDDTRTIFYAYGFGICNRVRYFSLKLFGLELGKYHFPELVMFSEVYKEAGIHGLWFPADDIDSRFEVLEKLIENCY